MPRANTRPALRLLVALVCTAALVCAADSVSVGASPKPIVDSIEPVAGPVAGGTSVTIRGRNFPASAAFTVTIGSQATSVLRRSASELVAKTAATAAGSYEVQVSDSHGASSNGPSFTYLAPPPPPPRVATLEPASGPAAGGTTVTIKGSGFSSPSKVDVCGEATAVDVRSETEITATTVACPAGSEEVIVSDASGISSGGPSFLFLAPAGEVTSDVSGAGPASDSAASSESSIAGFASSGVALASLGGVEASRLPAPVLAHSFDVALSGGILLVKPPGQHSFVSIQHPRQVPPGSVFDATQGVVTITAAAPNGGIQTGQFFGGEFVLSQRRDGLVLATLVGGDFTSCRAPRRRPGRAHASSRPRAARRVVRKLWANAQGSFATQGNDAAGAVADTEWLTEDLCDGTLIRVTRRQALVTNFITHRRLTVAAGHTYLASRAGASHTPPRRARQRPSVGRVAAGGS